MNFFTCKLPSMDLMRSEKMTFVQLIIPAESAHRAITYLGQLGLLQFRDVTSLSQIPIFFILSSYAFRFSRLFLFTSLCPWFACVKCVPVFPWWMIKMQRCWIHMLNFGIWCGGVDFVRLGRSLVCYVVDLTCKVYESQKLETRHRHQRRNR